MKGIIIEKPGMWMIRDPDTASPERLEEIERAIDKVKWADHRKKTADDRWWRRMWYINKWRMRNVKGPTITRE
jgi:hypothetical protein